MSILYSSNRNIVLVVVGEGLLTASERLVTYDEKLLTERNIQACLPKPYWLKANIKVCIVFSNVEI